MKQNRLFRLFSASVILALMLSLFSTLPAFADDVTPPAPTEEPVLSLAEEPDEEVAPAQEETTVADILQELPEDIEIVVVDAEGGTLPLASVEAAEVVAVPDPYFTVTILGVPTLFQFTAADCDPGAAVTPCSTPIQAAIDYLSLTLNATPDDGNIYVESGIYNEDVGINGNNWNGGLNTPASLSLVGTGSGSTILDGYFSIVNMNAFTLAGFTIIDVDSSSNPTYVQADGNSGDFQISDVNVTNSLGDGITITNQGGDISIINVNSSNNGATGIFAVSDGNITLTNVTANGNYDAGAVLDNGCGCSSGNIFVSSSTFNFNGLGNTDEGGLSTYSNGDITLTNVTTYGNSGYGAELDNTGGSGNITLTGTNTFNNNGFGNSGFGFVPSVGLYAASNADITLNSVTANENGMGGFGSGALIETFGNVFITNSVFNDNCNLALCGFASGLMVFADNLTLNHVAANQNGNGAVLGAGAVIFTNGNILITNSTFNGNGLLASDSEGAAILSGGSNIDIYCSTFSNNIGSTIGYGLSIDTAGTVTLNGASFGGNGTGDIDLLSGTLIQNPFDCNPENEKKKSVDDLNLPLNILHVVSAQTSELDCKLFSGTLLILPNGDRALFPCPLKDTGKLEALENDELPASLPAGNIFNSGLRVNLFKSGEEQNSVSPSLTISFVIPESANVDDLAILFWDGEKWVEVENSSVSADGHFEALVNFTGTYILISK